MGDVPEHDTVDLALDRRITSERTHNHVTLEYQQRIQQERINAEARKLMLIGATWWAATSIVIVIGLSIAFPNRFTLLQWSFVVGAASFIWQRIFAVFAKTN